jgi:MFS family permease
MTGAALIMSGFVGAFCTGFVLDYTKAYRTVLKASYYLAVLAWIFFLSNCRSNNFPLFIASGALMGFFTLPTIPSTIVSTVECSYPVPEDASVGFLYIGANLMAIVMTFVGQVLLGMSSGGNPAPLFPYGYWVISTLLLVLLPITLFQGQYFRLEEDTNDVA